ncbi:MAG: prolyl oligopeptidase family serine peptidase [Acidobacteria bacterium]|nr:prolyl oligopeptidase family serine peptidase [Acidobacteriota bacterium]
MQIRYKTANRTNNSLKSVYKLFILKALIITLFFSFTALTTQAQTNNNKTPLLDRELIFGNPEIAGAQLSPNGQFISFIKPFKGNRNIWVKRTNEPFEAAKPITADTNRPIGGYFWSHDSKNILYVQDKGGDENFNIFVVNPAEAPETGQEVPKSRNLTDVKAVRAIIYSVPESDPDLLYVGLNDRDAAWHDLYKVKISSGEKTLVRKNTDNISAWIFDLKDNLRLATRTKPQGGTEFLRVDDGKLTTIYDCSVSENCGPIQFHKDGQRLYVLSDKGETVDLARLTLLDVEKSKEEVVEADPKNRVDLSNAIFSPITDELIATAYVDEYPRIYWKDKEFEADYNLLREKLGNKQIGFGSSTKDGRLYLVSATSDIEPGETYLFDRKTKELKLQYRIRERIPREHLAEMKPISYKSSDGLEIPAYLTLPKGVEAKNLPLVVFPHGGPWARDFWGYHPYAQFLSNRGYAVLQVNFRASTGYGKKFLNAGNKQWGDKMQDDLTWGVKHLVAQGIVDSKRVGIMGGSYGGYATLAGLTFTPDVYAAGVSIVGPSNLITLLDTIPPYWEFIRKIFHERMGNPSTAEGKAQLERQSPLNSANKIKSPLLVVQGANDPRVKKAESDQIVIALRERGFPVEYILAPDEGHGFARPVNNMAMLATAEKFLAKHLGGRYQTDMTDEVSKRLGELTVDVKTVSLVKKVAAPTSTPKPAVALSAGDTKYKATIEVGGQKIPLDIVSSIKEENGNWIVSQNAQSAMGAISDSCVLEKETLLTLKRSVKQGPVTVDVDFKDNKATGTISVNGQNNPINSEVGGAVFADGPANAFVIATLPLDEGYSTTFRNFDVQTAKVKLMQLKVVGKESVTVPSGTFEAVKVEVTSAEGEGGQTTLWINKADRKPIKSSSVLPQFNGAVLTLELVP